MTTAVSNTAKRSSANTLFGQAVAVPLRLEPGKPTDLLQPLVSPSAMLGRLALRATWVCRISHKTHNLRCSYLLRCVRPAAPQPDPSGVSPRVHGIPGGPPTAAASSGRILLSGEYSSNFAAVTCERGPSLPYQLVQYRSGHQGLQL